MSARLALIIAGVLGAVLLIAAGGTINGAFIVGVSLAALSIGGLAHIIDRRGDHHDHD